MTTPAPFAWLPRCLPWLTVAIVLLCGLFAPLLANDVPLVAVVDGEWTFPAVIDLLGSPPPGPGDLDWKQWWSRLPAGGPDWAWMPPWPHGPLEIDTARFFAGPTVLHPFGNDDTGRDQLARIVHGAGAAVRLGVPAVVAAGLIGTMLGTSAGLLRGSVDFWVQRLIELTLCFPSLLFLLFAAAFFGSSWFGLFAVMTALFWISFARIVRGELLSLRERDFVLVARGLGVPTWKILLRHLWPQVQSQVAVTTAFCLAAAVVAESTLSFLGLGPGSDSSWGAMLKSGTDHAAIGAWHLWFFPALAIAAFVVSCHVLADRLGGRPV